MHNNEPLMGIDGQRASKQKLVCESLDSKNLSYGRQQGKNRAWNFKLLLRQHNSEIPNIKCQQATSKYRKGSTQQQVRQLQLSLLSFLFPAVRWAPVVQQPQNPITKTRPGSLRERSNHLHTSSRCQSQQAGHRFWMENSGCMVVPCSTECAHALGPRPGHRADDGAAAAWAFEVESRHW